MVMWPLDASGTSFMSECVSILNHIDRGVPLPAMLDQHYTQTSYALKRAILLKQQAMWIEEVENLPPSARWHATAKSRWGMNCVLKDYPRT